MLVSFPSFSWSCGFFCFCGMTTSVPTSLFTISVYTALDMLATSSRIECTPKAHEILPLVLYCVCWLTVDNALFPEIPCFSSASLKFRPFSLTRLLVTGLSMAISLLESDDGVDLTSASFFFARFVGERVVMVLASLVVSSSLRFWSALVVAGIRQSFLEWVLVIVSTIK